jgi:hypothetical protein
VSGEKIVVHKGRTCTVPVSLGIDVSADTFTSEIRTEADQEAPLIMTWTVTKPGGGTDGELLLTVDDSVTVGIKENSGFMDIKRVSGGQPIPLFDRPVEVEFRGTVTV